MTARAGLDAAATAFDELKLEPRTISRLLWVGAICALVIRIVWIWRYGQVIENEGTVYARLAASLRAGEGYIGIAGGPHVWMPPAFPFLIYALTPLAGSEELAARVVSCLAGVGLMFPAMAIVRRIAGPLAGLAAAAIVATHGTAMGFSGATYVEGTFFFFLFSATALTLRAIDRWSLGGFVLAGVTYGLAYLTRPEAIAYVLLSSVFILGYSLFVKRPILGACVRASVLMLVAAVVISPYVAWLSTNSGYFRLEGKSDSNGLVNERMRADLSVFEASRGIGTDLQPLGPDLIRNQFEIPRLEEPGLVIALRTVFDELFKRGLDVFQLWFGYDDSGNVLLGGLGFIGLLWALRARPDQRLVAALFACMTGGYVLLILAVRWFDWDRYIYPLTFFALLWAAVGVRACAEIAGRIAAVTATKPARRLARAGAVSVLVAMVSVSSLPARWAPMFFEAHNDWALALKAAGEWIAANSGARPQISGISAVVAYYARGDVMALPWAREDEADVALAYIAKLSPDFVVLRTSEQHAAPYIERWLANGIPHPCATAEKTFSEGADRVLQIYRWTCGPSKP